MMNWSALTKKQQYMVIATVVIAVAQILILIHFLGGRNSSAEAQSSKKELEELLDKVDTAKLMIKKSAMNKSALDETIEKLEGLSVHIPTDSDRYAWAYEYISRRAGKAGVALDSLEEIAYTTAKEEDSVALPYEIGLSTQCGYNQLVEFLWLIENDNPLLRIKEVDITTFPDSSEQHQVRLVLQWPATPNIERGDQ